LTGCCPLNDITIDFSDYTSSYNFFQGRDVKGTNNTANPQFLQVTCVCFFRHTADVLTIDQFSTNPANHALVHLLNGLCDQNLQSFNAAWNRLHKDGILHEESWLRSPRLLSQAYPCATVMFINGFGRLTDTPPCGKHTVWQKKIFGI